MSRNFYRAIGVGIISAMVMLTIVFGGGLALGFLLFGGINDMHNGFSGLDVRDGVLVIIGIAKVFCSGPALLLTILAVMRLMRLMDRVVVWSRG